MDDPAFMLLQLQENLRFMRSQFGAHVLSCITYDDGEPYWTYVLVTYDNYGNIQEYHEPFEGRAEWTNQPLEALKQIHHRVAGFVTNRLTHDCFPPLRTLSRQRYDEEVETPASGPDFYADVSNQDPQSPETSQFLQGFGETPYYQTQRLRPAHFPQPSPLLGSEIWPSTNHATSRSEHIKKQRKEDEQVDKSRKLGPAHFPQPSPALGSETWSFTHEAQQRKSARPAHDVTDYVFGMDGLSLRKQPLTASQRDRDLGRRIEPQDQSQTTKSVINTAASGHKMPSIGDNQQKQLRSRNHAIPSKHRESVQTSQHQLSSHSKYQDAPPWTQISQGRSTLPKSNNNQSTHIQTLPQPLSSHPPLENLPVQIMVDKETYDISQTDPAEFRRRLSLAQLALKEKPNRDLDPLTRAELEAQDFFREDEHNSKRSVADTLASLEEALRFQTESNRSRSHTAPDLSTLPLDLRSPASDQTITPVDMFGRRHRPFTNAYSKGDIPPSAPSSPSTSRPTYYPAYPPTLATSRSEATIRRNLSNSNDTMRRNISNSNDDMRRNTSGSNETIHSIAPFNDEEASLGAAHVSEDQGEHERDSLTLNDRARNAVRAVGRKVSDTMASRRLGSRL
ncbi:hypothetical protein AUEXF2481DRAFT_564066 [Aureobasidium subglaciale EXF-2481]|uniref:Uncharacterized protein n=1 Tax=Aureobasidium subglaciale (strain EXF-2481) TaxID=1043005 RepID=A0A074YPJ7_AURSE|nr:uncharacterized protein AUEXF2481DRAFT_564066 [Aureobasidium subglaciale EXF-2481]KAI5202442.1 hypothetical protein E4T38_05603 [Aureobasidium subglaciale]KAI5221260.1 hypothetical protein E4T40_05536 [Aureobasidium subglaciale]KAI5225274.1 hypothetical protein E4T41_05355 [Aureobasidium subglaciale]KAI5261377.1 hypothetical protein E4T46_05221 [Aureobasidium subglaciale]KEQ98064.1 hypothetical protein AUEXF2481DRAFT_564066 [Aureobasidium subglaciale EXF-2481]